MDPSHNMNPNTTDACPDSVVENFGHPQRATINTRVLKEIESELEEFEKVSIVFLLAAEYPAAYSTVLGLCRNMKERPCIISEYVHNNLDVWGEKLIEAFCIIGNHEVLQNLGYPKPLELSDRYHACIPRCTVTLNEAVKVLYKLFESMDSEKAKQLLLSVYKDCQMERQLSDTHYLELHVLYWLQEKYITISSDGTANFSNLLKHLKQLGYYSENIYHDVAHFCTSSTRVLDAVDSSSQGKPEPNKIHEFSSNNDVQLKDKKNMLPTIKKGICLIINEVEFPRPYETRSGSNRDRDNLNKTFKRRNFDILIRENLDKNQMKRALKEVSENFDVEKYDCLIVCILSHGYEGGVVTCDGLKRPIRDIEDDMCIWKLRNVIKLLIVQACQGENIGDVSLISDLATDGPRELNSGNYDRSESELSSDGPSENILRYNHFCRFMSTMGRFKSIRNKKLGTWFIEAVCDELSKNETISFPDWAAKVTANVQRNKGNVNGIKTASQLPEFTSRLHMMVYFPPYTDNEATEVAVTS